MKTDLDYDGLVSGIIARTNTKYNLTFKIVLILYSCYN
jgi:hypothetical protein